MSTTATNAADYLRQILDENHDWPEDERRLMIQAIAGLMERDQLQERCVRAERWLQVMLTVWNVVVFVISVCWLAFG